MRLRNINETPFLEKGEMAQVKYKCANETDAKSARWNEMQRKDARGPVSPALLAAPDAVKRVRSKKYFKGGSGNYFTRRNEVELMLRGRVRYF